MSSIILLFFLLVRLSSGVCADSPAPRTLTTGFYHRSCPRAEHIVQQTLFKEMLKEIRVAASILRLQFHDCFVNGCDGSVLLDNTTSTDGEKSALANIESLRSFDVIDTIKEKLEEVCPGVVSCADIIIMASRDAVGRSGGPKWNVTLGRLDSLIASQEDANDILPSGQHNASTLITLFDKFNLTIQDLVSLSGAHSIGKGRCFNVIERIYNFTSSSTGSDPSINQYYLDKLKVDCPYAGEEEVTRTVDLDLRTPTIFDNQYFHDLICRMGLFVSDQSLFLNEKTKPFVEEYAQNQTLFFEHFVDGMLKLGDLQSVDSVGKGEIRKNCRMVNAK